MSLLELPKIVAFGGGHGLYASLTALRRVTDKLTAVVTVADNGGSSGKLRAEFDCLPPGDLRMALAALCGDDHAGRTWAAVLQSRFGGQGPLAGHAIGNLLIAGLWQQLEDPVAGLDMVGDLLHTRGRVLPMSAIPLGIQAEVLGIDHQFPDEASLIFGQATIAKTKAMVRAVRLQPEAPPAHPQAVQAVQEADCLVLGPGSWFTSVIPHLLVPELARAIVESTAQRILILNVAPADETDGFSPAQHIEVLAEHAPDLRLDWVLADPRFVDNDPHLVDYVAAVGGILVRADVAARDGSPRHDPNRLAAALSEIIEIPGGKIDGANTKGEG